MWEDDPLRPLCLAVWYGNMTFGHLGLQVAQQQVSGFHNLAVM